MRGVLKDVVIIKGKSQDVYDEIVVVMKPEAGKNKTVFSDIVTAAEKQALNRVYEGKPRPPKTARLFMWLGIISACIVFWIALGVILFNR